MFSKVWKRIDIRNNSRPCSMSTRVSALTALKVFPLTNKAVFVTSVEEFSQKITRGGKN